MEIGRDGFLLEISDNWDKDDEIWVSISGPGRPGPWTYWLNRDELDRLIEHLVEVRDGD